MRFALTNALLADGAVARSMQGSKGQPLECGEHDTEEPGEVGLHPCAVCAVVAKLLIAASPIQR